MTGGFPSQRPVTRSFDVFFNLNKRSSKQSGRWWFETSSRSSWRHCNASNLNQSTNTNPVHYSWHALDFLDCFFFDNTISHITFTLCSWNDDFEILGNVVYRHHFRPISRKMIYIIHQYKTYNNDFTSQTTGNCLFNSVSSSYKNQLVTTRFPSQGPVMPCSDFIIPSNAPCYSTVEFSLAWGGKTPVCRATKLRWDNMIKTQVTS